MSPIAGLTHGVGFRVDKLEELNFFYTFPSSVSCLRLSAAIIGDFAFPDSISAPAPTPNRDDCFLPLYFPPKKVLRLCIFLPCHVYIPSIHSTLARNPRGYYTPKIYTRQSKDVQRRLDGQKTFSLYLLKNVAIPSTKDSQKMIVLVVEHFWCCPACKFGKFVKTHLLDAKQHGTLESA